MTQRIRRLPLIVSTCLLVASLTSAFGVGAEPEGHSRPVAEQLAAAAEFVRTYCLDCHSADGAERGFRLDAFAESELAADLRPLSVDRWEKALGRIRTRQMPPPEYGQPDDAEYSRAEEAFEHLLKARSKTVPWAAPAQPLRRLTRTEYENSIRDLLKLPFDAESILPADSSSDGFDNITVGELTPLMIDRYLTAATRISRAAIGVSVDRPGGITVRVPPDQTQEDHVAGLPFGTRGGTLITRHFPRSGQYEIQVRLTRDRDEKVEGITEPHQLDVLLDRDRIARFELQPIRGNRGHSTYDVGLNARVDVPAGKHTIGVTFVEKATSLQEIKREPFLASFNRHRHPRQNPAVAEVSIVGPFELAGQPAADEESASRQAIFVARPDHETAARQAARQIFTALMRRGYRRPVNEDDLAIPMQFFRQTFEASADQSDPTAPALQTHFEAGIESGLTSILVNPHFLFHTIRPPEQATTQSPFRLRSTELAAELASFLWRSLPDEELLAAAESGQLHDPAVMEAQTRRMLADSRSNSLVDSFADQWLYLRNLAETTPDLRRFPSFDNNLRESFAEETRRLFADIIARDASILDLIESDYTFLNERLARHYGIPGVIGSHFRRVDLKPEWRRGGILRHGSVLTVTSYATRTSPTIRGAWVLENILGTPPPPPPPNVPTIKQSSDGEPLTFREALAKHRADPSCASCHDLIDPVGFALDRYDAVGRWRLTEDGQAVDASGKLPDGQDVVGVEELERGILERPRQFATAMTRKLLTYAVGRPLTVHDEVAVRDIVASASERGFRFSDLVVSITASPTFQMRMSQ
jgi:hypothetical protein